MKFLCSAIMALALFAITGCGGSNKSALPATQNPPSFSTGAANDFVKNLSQAANDYITAVKAKETIRAVTLIGQFNAILGQGQAAANGLKPDEVQKLNGWLTTLLQQMRTAVSTVSPAAAAAIAPAAQAQNALTFSTPAANDFVKNLAQTGNAYIAAVRSGSAAQATALANQFNTILGQGQAAAIGLKPDEIQKLQNWINAAIQQVKAETTPAAPAAQNALTFSTPAANDFVKNLAQTGGAYIAAVRSGSAAQAAALANQFNTILGQGQAAANGLKPDEIQKLQNWINAAIQQVKAETTPAAPAPATAPAK